MNHALKNKRALITGGSRGIGAIHVVCPLAIASNFARSKTRILPPR